MNDTIEMYDVYYHIPKQQSYWKQSFGSVTCNLSTNGVNDKLWTPDVMFCYVRLWTRFYLRIIVVTLAIFLFSHGKL